MAGAQNEGSSCSTAASEHSDSSTSERRKRSNPSNDDAASCKPYECRFCPMKFAKSQALGGHMNRHRQEREREQVMNARKLLMQQDLSSIMIPGQNSPSPLSKYNQTHLQRSVSEGSLKDVTRMGMQLPGASAAACRGGLQANTYGASSLGPSSHSWNLATILENTTAAAHTALDGMLPQFQSRQAYSPLLTNDPSSYMLQQSAAAAAAGRLPTAAPGHHDMMLPFTYDKSAIQGPIFPYESNPHAMQRSNSMPAPQGSHPSQTETEGSGGGTGGILTGAGTDFPQHMMSSNRVLVNHGNSNTATDSSAKRSNPASLQPQATQQVNLSTIGSNSLQQYFSYNPAPDVTRTSMASLPNHSLGLDFNIGSSGQLDGLPWLLGNFKTGPALAADDYRQEVDAATDGKMNSVNSINSNASGQSKSARWDLGLPSPDNEDAEERIKDVTPGGADQSGAASLPFGVDYGHGSSTSDIDEGTYSQESKISK